MSKEAIRQIREAEEKANVLCRAAEERAADMRHRIKTQGEKHCADVERETEAEYTVELAEMQQRALDLEKKKCAEAEAEAQRMMDAAREHIEEAINIIVWEIVERCQ